MSLFSDVDWSILLLIGAFLLLGDRGKDVFRQLGRMYGKFLRLRDQFNMQVQTAIMEPQQSAGNGPLPVVQAGMRTPSPPPSVPASPPIPAGMPVAMAAEGPPGGNREVHTGSGVPSEGPEMFR